MECCGCHLLRFNNTGRQIEFFWGVKMNWHTCRLFFIWGYHIKMMNMLIYCKCCKRMENCILYTLDRILWPNMVYKPFYNFALLFTWSQQDIIILKRSFLFKSINNDIYICISEFPNIVSSTFSINTDLDKTDKENCIWYRDDFSTCIFIALSVIRS